MSVYGTVFVKISLDNFLGRALCIVFGLPQIHALLGNEIKLIPPDFPGDSPDSPNDKSNNARYILPSVLSSLLKQVRDY